MSQEFIEDQSLVTTFLGSSIVYGVSDPFGTPVDEVVTKDNFLKEYLQLAGGTMTGEIDMGSDKIINVTDPTADQDAATKKYVDDNSGTGHTIEEEGTPLTDRSKLNFVGAIVTATDDVGDDASDVTVEGSMANFNTALTDGTFAFISDKLDVFAATTSTELASVLSDETGSAGGFVRATSPTLVTPVLGTPSSGNLSNCTAYPGDGSLASVGTISSGVWQGAVIASAFLDADTMHLGDDQIVTEIKTFNDTKLELNNPALTFSYIFKTGAIVANRNISLPVLTAPDTFAFIGFANAWGTVNQNIQSTGNWQEGGNAISPIGTQTIWANSGAWVTRTTNGAEYASLELPTNDIMLVSFNFDQTTSEGVGLWWKPPANYNAGTIRFRPIWTAASGSGTFTCELSGRAYANSDAIDQALGTPQGSTDTLITANDIHIGPYSSQITLNGGPTAGEPVYLQITRQISDTLSADAKLIGIEIEYVINNATAT